MRIASILLIALTLTGCRNASLHEAQQIDRALQSFGFSNGRNYVFCLLCCDKNDAYRFSWTAENGRGETVSGQACAGLLFKGWTVRVD